MSAALILQMGETEPQRYRVVHLVIENSGRVRSWAQASGSESLPYNYPPEGCVLPSLPFIIAFLRHDSRSLSLFLWLRALATLPEALL